MKTVCRIPLRNIKSLQLSIFHCMALQSGIHCNEMNINILCDSKWCSINLLLPFHFHLIVGFYFQLFLFHFRNVTSNQQSIANHDIRHFISCSTVQFTTDYHWLLNDNNIEWQIIRIKLFAIKCAFRAITFFSHSVSTFAYAFCPFPFYWHHSLICVVYLLSIDATHTSFQFFRFMIVSISFENSIRFFF